ncbi:antibiotic biosynthesis monooxygenase [Shimwellia pseudoproteus]|uniref:antibiotic biosynthesis monooxygenase n=1 Tax=Shimwellia pseudoproteus TaxID=570012 RepID=UPI0018EE139F|nr:antibiotic biosynthesis monooxygenase [Shimwellia pseudoproteus]MBJ3814779.1 antibiotic biosynthesis monooxygenase [Shimwellia pseudoproteus]
MSVTAENRPVTLVITHSLLPEHHARYQAWLEKITPLAATFPGHLGASVIRPVAGNNNWNVVIHFDSIDNLYAWTQSEQRKALVAEITPFLAEGDHTEVRTEAEFWFTPASAQVRQPARWKQFLITLLVIFPSTNLVPAITGALLPGLSGTLLLHFINDACVVALVVWLWMPVMTRLFARWLKK